MDQPSEAATASDPIPVTIPPATPPAADVSRFQTFTPKRVHRKQLAGAEYNPRTISDDERKRLRKLLKRHGLFNALVWNQRTGNIIAGHQRIQILDALEGTSDYHLDVDVVDVDEIQEREMNIAHNNQMAAGDFDLGRLAEMFKGSAGLDIESTGFDHADIYKMFGDTPFTDRGEELAQLAQKVRELGEEVGGGRTKTADPDSTHFYTVVVWKDEPARDAAHETPTRLGN